MGGDEAVREAISVLKVPSQVRRLRTVPLPHGIPLLLAVAACGQTAEKEAVELTGRPIESIREAAGFFIAHVLLYPEADSYRMLGTDRTAALHELRTNMVLLMRWLHPDLDRAGEREHLAARVLGAWENLKSVERRSAYDATLAPIEPPKFRTSSRKPNRLLRSKTSSSAPRVSGQSWIRSIVGLFSNR